MSDVPKKLVVDLLTGVQQYIDLTPAEIAERDQDIAALAAEREALQAEMDAKEALKASARAKLVAGETLTEEEAAVLVI